ncbi:MAG: 50S ribosomal protein L35 [Planctomycetes bacterium RIFCSPHIGHO2_02_FULL_50_42]|nr:MAG: 50S ribosomal protein L35 [Planctomycetes bacterium GWA2_50_13]OHB90025.1 MAG: 50S ribosomal protein L35 [Planctomycetes bacterium RIFCSPHIGHO2_02_FULL_50_42]OHB91488.1 MAG: 50S ribosomal protein L35 [Planctomycetes bacterium RIFCSPHIGHO2_12_FULL_51_37]OHB95854.1 MAG: 50S ribosomal protein L35 [Planctomycetes bacterium RIFCSPLOWO2_02_FULL_50_16]OHC04413.1 MAG: 50S ribosomal protein L35 [Planctomycetes bacterium RIFCSPLOWO2_12_FULL_50_35]HCN19409.1 50S ribosomal protein L35 [Planctomyce
MPKIKTHKGLAKRVKITAGGKVKHAKPFKSHLMSTKNAKRCRRLRKKALITGVRARTIKRLLGQ